MNSKISGLIVWLVLCVAVTACFGDELIMKDGTVYSGTLVQSSSESVTFRTVFHGIETELTVPSSKVRLIRRATNNESKEPEPDSGYGQNGAPDSVLQDFKSLDGDGLRPNAVLTKLHGQFGIDILPIGFDRVIKRARRISADYIVLDIDSKGGQLWAAEDIAKMIQSQGEGVKFFAIVRNGISVSIWPIFSCDRIFVLPRSRTGGESMNSRPDGDTPSEVPSASISMLIEYAENQGYCGALVRSMVDPSAELFSLESQAGKFILSGNRPPLDNGKGRVRKLVGAVGILSLSAHEMAKYGLAESIDLEMQLGLAGQLPVNELRFLDLDLDIMDRWARECERRERVAEELAKDLQNQAKEVSDFLGAIVYERDAIDNALSTVVTLRRTVGRYAASVKGCRDCYPDIKSIIDLDEVADIQAGLSKSQATLRDALKEVERQEAERMEKVSRKRSPVAQPSKGAGGGGLPRKRYSHLGDGHWVSKILDRGNLIQLEDGSLWQVATMDRIDCVLWLVTESITVLESDNILYPYKLVNTNSGDVVEAKLLSD